MHSASSRGALISSAGVRLLLVLLSFAVLVTSNGRGRGGFPLQSTFDEPGYQANFATDGVTIGGWIHPRDSSGLVNEAFFAFFQVDGFLELETNRIVDGPNNWTISNPSNNSVYLVLEFPGVSTAALKTVDWVAVGSNPFNTTILNKTITVTDGIKVSISVLNDSNSLNASTLKAFTVTFNLSHPLTNLITNTETPNPYSTQFVLETAFYSIIFTQVTFADGDGKEVYVNMSLYQEYDTAAGITQIVFTGLTEWETNWIYDPEIAILVSPQGSGGGDGDLSVILPAVLVPVIICGAILLVIFIGIVSAIIAWRHKRKFIRREDGAVQI